MDIYENQYFELNRKLASFIGIWPTQPYKERMLRYYIVGSLLLLSLFAQLCPFFTLDFDLRSVAIRLEILVPCMSITSIYCAYVLQFVTLQKIFSYIHQDWQRLKNDVDMKIMQKHIYETKIFIFFCVVSFIIYSCSIVFPTTLRKILSTSEKMSTNDRFPLATCFDYFFDRETYYYFVVISQITVIFLGSVVSVASFSTYFWIVQHICARLSIIKCEIQRPFIENHHNHNVLVKPIDLTHWIINIIQQFSRNAELMKLVNTLSENCYLIEMSLAFLIITVDFLCIPTLLEQKENRNDVFASVFFVTGTLLTIYVNCYIGQRLIDYSTDVYKEVCLIPIYGISLETQKLLLMTLTMNVKPCAISIGKMFVSSHEFFSNVLQTSLSFAMMLHSMHNM